MPHGFTRCGKLKLSLSLLAKLELTIWNIEVAGIYRDNPHCLHCTDNEMMLH